MWISKCDLPGPSGQQFELVQVATSSSYLSFDVSILFAMVNSQISPTTAFLGRVDLCLLSHVPVLIYVRGSYSASREVQQDPTSRRGRLDLLYE